MQYRRFGRTEIEMPVISVGGMRFQSSWKREDPVKSEHIDTLNRIVDKALKAGLYHIETAWGYGTSEQELGEVLSGYDRSEFVLQTKGGPKEDVKEFLNNIEESLKGLKVDYLDLFAIHGLNNDEILARVLQKGGVLDELIKLKEQGVIRHIGFSSHGPTDTIAKAARTGQFDYMNLWYFYINQWNRPAIEAATEQDMGVFIISPNDKGGKLYAPTETFKRLTAPLDPMAFNDLFILSHPEIHTISCGVARPEDFDIHLDAVNRMDELVETVAAIKARLDDQMDGVKGADWAGGYLQGLPDWSETPGQLNIGVVLWLWNLAKAYDMVDYAKMRYNLMGNADHWFPGCKSESYPDIDREALATALKESAFADQIIEIMDEAHEMLKAEEVNRLSEED